jgi:hypothetical protein
LQGLLTSFTSHVGMLPQPWVNLVGRGSFDIKALSALRTRYTTRNLKIGHARQSVLGIYKFRLGHSDITSRGSLTTEPRLDHSSITPVLTVVSWCPPPERQAIPHAISYDFTAQTTTKNMVL